MNEKLEKIINHLKFLKDNFRLFGDAEPEAYHILRTQCQDIIDEVEELKRLGNNTNDSEESNQLSYGELAWKLGKVMLAMNNEEASYGSWLYLWPDGESKEECLEDFGDKESYDELKKSFKRIYTNPEYHDGGLYTNDQSVVDYAHQLDKEFGLKPIVNYYKDSKKIKDSIKIKFKDGYIVEVLNSKNKSKKEIIDEARKAVKALKLKDVANANYGK